jgi:hypothetical protein
MKFPKAKGTASRPINITLFQDRTIEVHHHRSETPDGDENHVELERPIETILLILEKTKAGKGHIEDEGHSGNDGGNINDHAKSFLYYPNVRNLYYYSGSLWNLSNYL